MHLVPAEEGRTDLRQEIGRLHDLANAPVTPSIGASAVSPTIAGTPGSTLSGVLANTEGLPAFEQIIKLREVGQKWIVDTQGKTVERKLSRRVCIVTPDTPMLSLPKVLAAMRDAARQDAETAQAQLEELQANAPDRIQEAYRRGAYCSCDMPANVLNLRLDD